MAKVITHMCMSLDGFVAQPDDDPAELFEWCWAGDVAVPSVQDGTGSAARRDGGSQNPALSQVLSTIC